MKKLLFLFLLFTQVSKAQIFIGGVTPEISLPDAKDSIIHLSDFKGKVVLIDFWASWCGPCRYSNPRMVALYKKYKDKGFEIFGVSLDVKKKDWVRAVKHDRITYTQVNDSDFWNSAVANAYHVNEIPTTFLLDKNGILVAVNLEGKELINAIEEQLQR